MAPKSIKILICLAFVFSAASFFSYTISAERERVAYFQDQEERRARNDIVFSGPYCYPDKHPNFLLSISFLTALTAVSIFFSRRPYLSAALSFAALSMFPYWFYDTKNAISQAENVHVEGLDFLIIVADRSMWWFSPCLRSLRYGKFGRFHIFSLAPSGANPPSHR